MKLNERKKVAIALGYYARAVGEIKNLADAIAAYALDEYRNDIDCQVGFRKGYQEAEEHLAKNGQEAHELRELVGWIARLEQQVHEQRKDILEYLKRQEALSRIPLYEKVSGGYYGAEPQPMKRGDDVWFNSAFSGGSGGSRMINFDPDGTITEIGGGGGCLPGHGHVGSSDDKSILDGPFQMRRVDNGELLCQDGKPVVHQGYKACMEACQYLYDNMGIQCAPSAGRQPGQEWTAPVFNIDLPPVRQHSPAFRWHGRLENDLQKEDPFHNQDS